jgi:rare lipoprotein A
MERVLLLASLLALSLGAQQAERKPSPFPEKNRETGSAAAAGEKSEPRQPRSARGGHANAATSRQAESALHGITHGATGKASFFTSSANGALTASGSRLNAAELVAAHATYPLGSFVKVTNLKNGKTAEVQIVDRFPVSERIINVSEAAARQLGFLEAGTTEVHLELASQGPDSRDHK